MSEATYASREPTARTPVFVATFAALLAAIFVMLAFDLFLARLDRRASESHAASLYADGVARLRSGRPLDAIDLFAAAVSVNRRDPDYSLALGEAQRQAHRFTDAEAPLRALLERTENDGAVNLAMARVMLGENRVGDAKVYFHRAIFGLWGADSITRRLDARFELIELLATHGQPQELLAELLPFDATPPDSVALRRRLGFLFLQAGSPARAASMLREVVRRHPSDADAYAGMGEAALALGNLETARVDFAEARRLKPGDPGIAARSALVDSLLDAPPAATRRRR